MGIKHPFTSPKPDGADATKVKPSDWNTDHTIDGDVDFGGHAVTNIEDEAYNQTAWDGSLEAPTKNAIRDKIEALVLSGGGVTDFLALDDTPDTYVNASGGAGPYLQVNTAETAVEFKYSTENYIDIRDYGTVTDGGDISAAWTAAMNAIATHKINCIRIPKVGNGIYTIDPTTIPGLDGVYAGSWTFEFDCGVINPSSTVRMAGDQTWRGLRTGSGGTLMLNGAFPAAGFESLGSFDTGNGDAVVSTHGAVNVSIENLAFRGNVGPAFYVNGGQLIDFHRCVFSCNDSLGAVPCVIMNSTFWINMYDIFISPAADVAAYAILFMTDTASGHLTLSCGLIRISQLRTVRNGLKFQPGGPTYIPSSGPCQNYIIEDYIVEGPVGNMAILDFDSTVQQVGGIEVIRPGIADAVSGVTYLLKNTSDEQKKTSGIHLEGTGLPIMDVGSTQFWDPSSTHPIDNLTITDNTNDNFAGGVPAQLASMYVGSPSVLSWSRWHRNAIDAKLLTAPIPGANWNYGTPLNVIQDPAGWTVTTGTKTTGLRGPDGSSMAALCTGQIECMRQSLTLALGDWIIGGVWCRSTTGGNTVTGISIGNDGAFPNYHFWEWNGEVNPASYYDYGADSDYIPEDGWRWVCGARQITSVGDLNPIDVVMNFNINSGGSSTTMFFAPAAVHIPASEGEDDAWAIRMARMLRGGWSSKCPAGSVSILDHQRLWAGSGMAILDGVTAPTTVSGFAQIYVDTADGDLKVKFGDGTIKTIVVDT